MRTRLSDETLKQIRYCIYSGDLSNHFTYDFWKDRWSSLMVNLGSHIDDSEFLSQHKVTVLKHNDEIVAMHLLKTYSASEFSHPYFAEYPEIAMARIKRLNRVQTLQYFIVDENWSPANTLVNFGAILLCLSLKNQIHDGIDASISIARTDVSSASLGFKVGFEEIGSGAMHNVPVKYVMCTTPTPFPKDDVNKWVEFYWKNRIEDQPDLINKVA